jgi:thiol-disulfide isomerase/thioredoxin
MRKFITLASISTIAIFFTIILIATIGSGGTQGRPGLNEISGEVDLITDKYLPIKGKDINGDIIENQDTGEVLVIDFWASWCPPCIQEALILSESSVQWENKNVRFIGIALWDNEDSVKKFIEKNSINYTIKLDESGESAISYGVKALPEKFFINKKGLIVKKYIGPIDKKTLDKILLEVIEGE